jgi:hypothetical protein
VFDFMDNARGHVVELGTVNARQARIWSTAWAESNEDHVTEDKFSPHVAIRPYRGSLILFIPPTNEPVPVEGIIYLRTRGLKARLTGT